MGKKYNNKYKEYYINKLLLYMISILVFILANLYTSIDIKANECQEDENLKTGGPNPTYQAHPDIFRPPIMKKKYKKITKKYLDNICIEEYEYHENGYTINYTIYNNNEIISYGYDKYDNFSNLISGENHYTNPNTNSKEIYKEVHEYNNFGKETKEARYTISEDDGSILESAECTMEYDNRGNRIKNECTSISRVYPVEGATYTVSHKSTSSETYEYDENNRIIKATNYLGDTKNGYKLYEYDNNGFLIKWTAYSPNDTVSFIQTYEYDENNNCIKISSGNGYVTYEYDKKGNIIKRITYSNDDIKTCEEIYEYDSNGFEIKEEIHTNDRDDIFKNDIEYDSDGDLKKATQYDNTDYYKDYNGIAYIIEYEYYDETPPEDVNNTTEFPNTNINNTTEKPSTNVTYVDMYRLYNPNSGEHFYTASAEERDFLASVGWNYEGVAWKAPTISDTPVYRLYNPNAGDHHYTTSAGERDFLVNVGWNDEGIGWYSAPNSETPLYRLYNPNAETGAHHFTANAGERDFLVSVGWNYEDIAWYGGK